MLEKPLNWFCLYVVSGFERTIRNKVADGLRNRFGGHMAVTVGPDAYPWEAWYPVATRVHRSLAGGTQRVEYPAIHNYVFVRIPADPGVWAEIKAIDGVISFLNSEDEDGYETPLIIPSYELDALFTAEQTGKFDAFATWQANRKAREARRKAKRRARPLAELAAALNEAQEGEAA